MEQIIYERPREKMRTHGAASLTNVELLQVIIGSGSAHMPVARIARKVADLLFIQDEQVTYQKLTQLKGLGSANASRIVAVIQLATRLNERSSLTDFKFDSSSVGLSKKQVIMYATHDGSGKIIELYLDPIKRGSLSAPVAKSIYAKALADKAAALSIAIGYRAQQLEPGLFELSFVQDAKSIAALLQIRLLSIELVNKEDKRFLLKGSRL